ncbi:MAG: cell wall-binding repeat-containing protein, partial [Catenulispora sp.]
KQAFSDPGYQDSAPQVSQQGYLFFDRAYSGVNKQGDGLAVLRPGDKAPERAAGFNNTAISPDATRYAFVEQQPAPGDVSKSVYGVLTSPMNSYQTAVPIATVPVDHTITAVTYRPGGDIVFADRYSAPSPGGAPVWTSAITSLPDRPNPTPHVIATVIGAVTSVDVQPGAPLFGVRPAVDRIGGSDRVSTSVDASRWSYDAYGTGGRRANAAVLARSDTFADALGGTALALEREGPLMLTMTNSLDAGVAKELTRILPPHSTVYILGGTSAISPAVEAKVKALGFMVQRLGGVNRFATAATIADEIDGYAPDTIMVATGADYPDALAAGVAAGQDRLASWGRGRQGGVVLLTDGTNMPPETRTYLEHIDPKVVHVYAVGGQAVKAVAKALPSLAPSVTPLAGADRYETAAKVANSDLFGAGAAGRYTMVGIATGINWPDALSGGALIGNQGGPLLLADSTGVVGSEKALLTTRRLKGLAVFGGPAAVSDNALTSTANAAFAPGTWDSLTDRQAPSLP